MRFAAAFDPADGSSKCNCTFCWKHRWWAVRVRVEGFRDLGGAAALSGYDPKAGEGAIHGGFCRHCGTLVYRYVPVTDWNPAPYVSVGVATLDDLDPAEILAGPVLLHDGRHDNWWNPPAESRHL